MADLLVALTERLIGLGNIGITDLECRQTQRRATILVLYLFVLESISFYLVKYYTFLSEKHKRKMEEHSMFT